MNAEQERQIQILEEKVLNQGNRLQMVEEWRVKVQALIDGPPQRKDPPQVEPPKDQLA